MITRVEAIKNIKEHCYFANLKPQAKEALDMAIKALEQEPCEDAIPRSTAIQLVNDVQNNCGFLCYTDYEYLYDHLSTLPSVNPQEPNREIEDYENEIEDLHNRLDIAEYDKERSREEVTNLEAKIEALEQEPLTEENYNELNDRFGEYVVFIVKDMVSGKGERWKEWNKEWSDKPLTISEPQERK